MLCELFLYFVYRSLIAKNNNNKNENKQCFISELSTGTKWILWHIILLLLKENASEDASWHKNVEKEQIFSSAGFIS